MGTQKNMFKLTDKKIITILRSLDLCCTISYSITCYPMSAQGRLWLDLVDAQVDQSLLGTHDILMVLLLALAHISYTGLDKQIFSA